MSGRYKALLVDMGNTRIKYSLVNGLEDLDDVKYCQTPKQLCDAINVAEQVLVSSVGHAVELSQLQKICQQNNKPCRAMETEAESLGIQSAYQSFQTLGVDRWLAILAAREITALPVAVIDLGTANTCDIIVGNRHTGGWISPGFSLMRSSLLNNTQQVFGDEDYPASLQFGKSTPECVNFGCLAAQSGFVLMAEQYLKQTHEKYVVLVSGGSQALVSLSDNSHVQFFTNLVLRGLFRFI